MKIPGRLRNRARTDGYSLKEEMVSFGRLNRYVLLASVVCGLLWCRTNTAANGLESATDLPEAGACYYVDGQTGDDSYSGTIPQRRSDRRDGPLRTIQAGYDRLRGGQTLLVRKGVYRETLTLGKKASASHPIVIRPFWGDEGLVVISAADEINTWQRCTGPADCAGNLNWPHIFYADVDFEVKQLFQNGSRLKPSRYPNQGWRYPTSTQHSAPDTVLLDWGLQQSDHYFVGSICHVKTNLWQIDHIGILAYSMAQRKITLESPTRYDISPSFGYYITHAVGDIDEQGQWARDNVRGRIYLWPVEESLDNIEATSRQFGIDCERDCSYHTIQDLVVKYADDGIRLYKASHMTLAGNTVEYAYCCGILDFESSHSSIVDNTVRFANGSGIRDREGSSHNLIEGNTVYAIGAENIGDDLEKGVGHGIIIHGDRARVIRNRVDRSGYTGIYIGGDTSGKEIAYNYITNSCLSLSDGAGIYTSGKSPFEAYDSFHHNVVTDIWGYLGGSAEYRNRCSSSAGSCRGKAHGIYLDEEGNHRAFEYNTVVAGGDSGIFFHWTRDNRVIGNTLYGNARRQILFHGESESRFALRNNEMLGNLLIATEPNQVTFLLDVEDGNVNFGASDNNYFYSPGDARHIVLTKDPGDEEWIRYSLEEWQALSGHDIHSVDLWSSSGTPIVSGMPVVFVNPTTEPQVVDLQGTVFLDIFNQPVRKCVTIEPFGSVVLLPLAGTANSAG